MSGWVLYGSSLCSHSGRRGWAHRENLDLLVWYQIMLGTPPPPTPTVWGSEGPPSPPAPTGRQTGGIHIKVTGEFEGGKVQGWTAVFRNDDVLIRFTTRPRLELIHQEVQRRQGPLSTVPAQPLRGGKQGLRPYISRSKDTLKTKRVRDRWWSSQLMMFWSTDPQGHVLR